MMRGLILKGITIGVFAFSSHANSSGSSSDISEVNIDELVSGLLSGGGGGDWIILGELDVDSDGDLDVLITSQSRTPDSQLSKGGYIWTVYFNEGGSYFYSHTGSMLPFYSNDVEYRRIRQSNGKRALLWHDNRPGKSGSIIAVWYERKEDGGFSQEMVVIRKDSLMALQGDEVGGEGISIDKILENYRRLDVKKAMRGEEGVSSFEEGGRLGSDKTNKKEKVIHAQEADPAQEEVGKEKSSILAALVVLVSLGFVAAFAFYRRRRG